MAEVISEPVVNGELKESKEKEEDCDKDSGNQSGDDMDNGEEVTCGDKVACELDKDGPHCHVDTNGPPQAQKSQPGSRRNSIAEELKAKIASAAQSRRNSFGSSRRSSLTSLSRRGSVQSIKEDPTCEEKECQEADKGDHCHEPAPDPTCDTGDTCPQSVSGDHCHVDNGAEKITEAKDDLTCQKKNGDCPDAAAGDHCHENGVDNVNGDNGQGQQDDDNDDVIINGTQDNDDRKQLSPEPQPEQQTTANSPGLIVNNPPVLGVETLAAVSPAPTTSNDSTPLTARKVIQTPVNMNTTNAAPSSGHSVAVTMPPSEHSNKVNKETVILTNGDTTKDATPAPAQTKAVTKTPERKVKTPVKEVVPRARSKSRASSPSSESRRSRFSSKERKSKCS